MAAKSPVNSLRDPPWGGNKSHSPGAPLTRGCPKAFPPPPHVRVDCGPRDILRPGRESGVRSHPKEGPTRAKTATSVSSTAMRDQRSHGGHAPTHHYVGLLGTHHFVFKTFPVSFSCPPSPCTRTASTLEPPLEPPLKPSLELASSDGTPTGNPFRC